MSNIFEDPRYQIVTVAAFTIVFIFSCACVVLCCIRGKRKGSPQQLYVSMGSMSPGFTTFLANSHNAHYRLLEEYDGQREEVEALLGEPDQAPESRRLFAAAPKEKDSKAKVVSDSRRKISDVNDCLPRYETVDDYPQKESASKTYKI